MLRAALFGVPALFTAACATKFAHGLDAVRLRPRRIRAFKIGETTGSGRVPAQIVP